MGEPDFLITPDGKIPVGGWAIGRIIIQEPTGERPLAVLIPYGFDRRDNEQVELAPLLMDIETANHLLELLKTESQRNPAWADFLGTKPQGLN